MTRSSRPITLPTFFETTFIQAHQSLSSSNIRSFRYAVNCFCDWLGCRVTCSLVTNQLIDEFRVNGTHKPKTMHGLAVRLRTIMRMFDPAKFPRYVSQQHRVTVTPMQKDRRTKGKGGLPMLEYVDRHFFTARSAAGVFFAESTRKHYRATVLMFYRFAAREVSCDEVNETMLAAFAEWQRSEGCARYATAQRLSAIRAVVRNCFPDRWPIERGRTACLSFHESGTKGTLEQIFVDEYLPQRTRIGSVQTVRQYGRCLRLYGSSSNARRRSQTSTISRSANSCGGWWSQWTAESNA